MTPAQRLDALALRGVQVYLDDAGQLTVKCEPCFVHVLEAAVPMLRQRKAEIVRELERQSGMMS